MWRKSRSCQKEEKLFFLSVQPEVKLCGRLVFDGLHDSLSVSLILSQQRRVITGLVVTLAFKSKAGGGLPGFTVTGASIKVSEVKHVSQSHVTFE